ncbi:uncharacterized protein LOC117901182 [Drosophila subobscura]|uniref:uncharacterized protein LOC117901182 n=1 Tax=Drosophila subobscura TaxID=7241 RepID=UPI00155ACB4F|nr:uncharacterized protein LOC117901182 [Drosophila subobscura]
MVYVVLAKLGVVAGVAFATKQLGVWESSEHSAVLLENARDNLRPYAKSLKHRICCWKSPEQCEEEFEPKPWRDAFVDSWNDAVKKGFLMLYRVPSHVQHFTEDVEKVVTNFGQEKEPKMEQKLEQNMHQKATSSTKSDKTAAKAN